MKSWSAQRFGDVLLGKLTITYVLAVPHLYIVICASSVGVNAVTQACCEPVAQSST